MLTLSPGRLEDILRDIETIGTAIGREEAGIQLSAALRRRLTTVRATVGVPAMRLRVACIEWLSPLYTAGHWVPDMVAAAGGIDILAQAGTVSRTMDWDTLAASEPDVIVLMPCGFTVPRTKAELASLTAHPQWRHLCAVQRGEIYLVDALSYFSRPGPRLIDGVEQLAAIFHPASYGRHLPASVERLEGQTTHSH
jgi:iron complex transport system substrate-binding protein